MHPTCIGGKRILMCHDQACNAHEELSCLGCLVDHCMSFAKGSRAVVVLRFSCIYWYCVMRLTGVKDLDSLGGVYFLPSQLFAHA
jgi:hypothetical protein